MTASTLPYLTAVHTPIAVYPEYVRDQESTLDLAQLPMSMSGSDFAVKDESGQIFQCTGAPLLSRGDAKVITDMGGRVLYRISNKTRGLNKVFTAENAAGEVVLTVQQNGMRANFVATFTNAVTKKEATILLKGNVWASKADITLALEDSSDGMAEATPIGLIKRDIWSKEDIFLNRQRHTLSVAPGVDVSLLAVITMCFDEWLTSRDDLIWATSNGARASQWEYDGPPK